MKSTINKSSWTLGLFIGLMALGSVSQAQVTDPATGHAYEAVPDGGIAWADAKAIAESMTYNGMKGHLATLTSAAENSFVAINVPGAPFCWLGASQPAGETVATANWQWVTGEPFSFSNWAPREPNDYYGPGSEQYMMFWRSGSDSSVWNDQYDGGARGGFVVEYEPIAVTIDIKPGSDPNSINLGSSGTVPVAILSTSSFDAATVDPTTVTLAGASVALKGKGTLQSSLQDVNGDGLLDLVVHVSTQTLQLTPGDTVAVLEGSTFGGDKIQGWDTVRIVP